jgi:RNA polymerase sigma-70 factor (ECF subfamily)
MRFWRETQVNAVDVDVACDRLPSTERSPETQLLARKQATQIWKIAQGLSVRERSVFLLRYVEELELREIGYRTGLKAGAVKVYLARALAKVPASLEKADKYCNDSHILRLWS